MTAEPRGALQVTPPERLRRLPTWLINQVGLRATRLIHERIGRPGARADFAVLSALEEFGRMSQAELGRRLGLDRSDIAVVLNRLEGDRLAERTADDGDRRRNVITLTPTGVQALEDLQQALGSAQSELLGPLDNDEQAQLVRLLQRLVDHHPTVVTAPASAADQQG